MSEGEDLLARVRAGEEEAARLFFREHYPGVFRIVRNHASCRHSEEDLCQMIFMKVFAHLDQYSGRVPVAHWISRIAVNTCLAEAKRDRQRRELREADLGENAALLLERVADTSVENEATVRSARGLVATLLDHLSPEDRLVVSLLYIEQLSVAEVGALTGFSQPLVKIRAFRARRKLHNLVTRMGLRLL